MALAAGIRRRLSPPVSFAPKVLVRRLLPAASSVGETTALLPAFHRIGWTAAAASASSAARLRPFVPVPPAAAPTPRGIAAPAPGPRPPPPPLRSRAVRYLSSTGGGGVGGGDDDDDDHRLGRRHLGLVLNPDGVGRLILPGDYVAKTDAKTGQERRILADRALGFFWMMRDLRETDGKPILSNKSLIPAAEAKTFPDLGGCEALDSTVCDLPHYLLRKNRSKDATAQCTLVGISYKEFGYRMLPSWLDPFREALCDPLPCTEARKRGRCEAYTLSVQEGRVLKMLRRFVTMGFLRNTPEERHSDTLLYFGNAADFRDELRMHNTIPGYVYLLDGLGRVRWAGSGNASDAEVEGLIGFARELTTRPTRAGGYKREEQKIAS